MSHTPPSSVRITRLSNGLQVATDTMSSVETASIGVWVEAGGRFESADINGISHMLEHMTFKGTRKRSAQAIAGEIEDVGGQINAYTSRENTAYYAKVLKEDAELAVDITADLVQNAILDPTELERERQVILQEIGQAQDTPDDVVFDLFQEAAYPDQALGRPVLGTIERVKSMGRDTMMDYMHHHYSAPRMVLAAAGNIEHEQMVEMAQSHFNQTQSQNAPIAPHAQYTGGEVREKRDQEQAHLLLGFAGPTYEDPDFYAASTFSNLFGGGMSSRLFQEVREKRGLVYSVYSFLSAYTDTGLFGIYAASGAEQVDELLDVIGDEILKARDSIDESEITRARAQMKASILMSRESTGSRAESLARQLMVFGRPISVEEIVEKIDAVNIGQVLDAATRLTSGTPTLTLLSPSPEKGDFGALHKRLN